MGAGLDGAGMDHGARCRVLLFGSIKVTIIALLQIPNSELTSRSMLDEKMRCL